MLSLYLLLFYYAVGSHQTLLETDFYSPKVGLHFSISIVYDLHFVPEPKQDISKVLHEVVHYIEETYPWKDTVNFRFVHYTSFELRRDTTAIVSVLPCEQTWDLFHRVSDDGLLFISLTDCDCPRLPEGDAVTVPLVERGRELSQFLLDLRTTQIIQWKSVAIISDYTIDSKLLESVVNAVTSEVLDRDLNKQSSLAMVYTIEPAHTDWERRNNVVELLSVMPKLEENSNFLVIISFDLIGVILDVVKQMQLMRPICQWLFVLPHPEPRSNLHDFAVHLTEGANIAFIYNTTIYHSRCSDGLECHLVGLMQSLVEGLDTAARAELDKSKKVSEEEWEQIKPSKAERKSTLLHFIKKRLRSSVKCGNCTVWRALTAELWGQEFLSSGPTSHLLDVGYWNPREASVLSDHLFPHVKYGFRQLMLPIASFHFPPWQIIKYNSSGHPVEFKGVVFEIIDLIAKKFNFTYNVTLLSNFTNLSADSVDGSNSTDLEIRNSRHENVMLTSLWDQLIGMVKEKKIFLGACALTISDTKSTVVNFTEPVSIETYVFLVSRPKELSRALLFILPFTSDAWLCIIGSIILMAPTLYLVNRLSPYYDYHDIRKTRGLGKVVNCFWYVYGALLQQGGAYLPTADSGRLIVGTWWIVVLVIVTTYCGNLVAFLTFPKLDKLVTNVHDLLERKDFLTWGIPDGSFIKNLLMSTDDPKLQELYRGAQLHAEVTPEVVDSVRRGHHAYIQSKTRLLYLMKSHYLATNSCHFSLGSEEFVQEKLGMMMSRDNPYLELFNKEIGRMHRLGLVGKWLRDYLPPRDRCYSTMYSSVVNNHTVNLDDMQGCFFVLFLGLFLSVVIIIIECLLKKYRLAKEQQVIRPFVE